MSRHGAGWGRRMYYESFGAGRPIIFLPGWGGDFLNRIQADERTYALTEDPAARFEGPTLTVTGRQDTITGYADAWSILDDYPRATYAVLDQQDHGLPVRRLAAYHALVADWLDRMEGREL